jgi:acyl-CoA thioester hydrolase
MRESRARYRVIYGDTDAMGIVYYGNYLRLFEIGRNELIREAGIPYEEIERRGFMLPVAEARARYHESARYDDLIEITTAVTALKRVSVEFGYTLTRVSDGARIAEGATRHACLDRESRKMARFPEDVIAALADG